MQKYVEHMQQFFNKCTDGGKKDYKSQSDEEKNNANAYS